MFNEKKGLRNYLLTMVFIMVLLLIAAGCSEDRLPVSETKFFILATTTSTYDSGLLDFLNPVFTEQTGIEVQVVSQGTGAALEAGKRGDADALLVHDRESELDLVEQGYFIYRNDVMYNDFIIVGPVEDSAGVTEANSALEAYNLIADGKHIFISRGDDSGTNRVELRLWEKAGIDPETGDWYLAVGQGMGETLRVANEIPGYTLTDRGTYAANRDNLELIIVLEGDPMLFNQYGIMAVNPGEHPHARHDLALTYIEFLMSEQGRQLIESYRVNGEPLFFPGLGGL